MSEKMNDTNTTEVTDDPSVEGANTSTEENGSESKALQPAVPKKARSRKVVELPTEDKWAGF